METDGSYVEGGSRMETTRVTVERVWLHFIKGILVVTGVADADVADVDMAVCCSMVI